MSNLSKHNESHNQAHNAPSDQSHSGAGSKRKGMRRWIVGGLSVALVGVLSIAGISQASDSGHFGHGFCQHDGHGMHDQASMDKHIARLVDHVAGDGTAQQKASLTTIAKAAMTDLHALREQHQSIHEQAMKVLTQPTIDRAALEQSRVDAMRLAEQASKRITQALADAADVLTPAQRLKLAEHLKKHMG